jgi:hypothetical protein
MLSQNSQYTAPATKSNAVEALKNMLSIPTSKDTRSPAGSMVSYDTKEDNTSAVSHETKVKALKKLLLNPSEPVSLAPKVQTNNTMSDSSSHESTVQALKNILIPAPQSPQKAIKTPQKSNPKAIPSASKLPTHDTPFSSSPPSSSSESELKSKSARKKSKKKSTEAPAVINFYAGSAFQNSPDPLSIPIPNFDDFDTHDHNVSPLVYQTPSDTLKTESLRRMLHISRAS